MKMNAVDFYLPSNKNIRMQMNFAYPKWW